MLESEGEGECRIMKPNYLPVIDPLDKDPERMIKITVNHEITVADDCLSCWFRRERACMLFWKELLLNEYDNFELLPECVAAGNDNYGETWRVDMQREIYSERCAGIG